MLGVKGGITREFSISKKLRLQDKVRVEDRNGKVFSISVRDGINKYLPFLYEQIRSKRVRLVSDAYDLFLSTLKAKQPDAYEAFMKGKTVKNSEWVISSTVEGRERYPIRVRYPRELRDSPEALGKILIATPTGAQIPLGQLVQFEYKKGPQAIKSEDTFLVGFVLFDKNDGYAEVDVVNDAQKAIQTKIDSGELVVPQGVNYKFSGSYENQIRAMKRLSIVIPICLIVIFLLLYFQFKTVIASSIHFSGVFVAFAGGFIMLWLYGQDWFMNFAVADVNMRDLFKMHPINLSVAVWVGFIALFGIATDDGVIMGSYIHQVFEEKNPQTITEVRNAVVEAGKMRVRPAVMTAATTIIALLPVLTSTGKGSDIMIPMAIPTFGGMTIQIMTMFVVPVLQAYWRETVIKNKEKRNA